MGSLLPCLVGFTGCLHYSTISFVPRFVGFAGCLHCSTVSFAAPGEGQHVLGRPCSPGARDGAGLSGSLVWYSDAAKGLTKQPPLSCNLPRD